MTRHIILWTLILSTNTHSLSLSLSLTHTHTHIRATTPPTSLPPSFIPIPFKNNLQHLDMTDVCVSGCLFSLSLSLSLFVRVSLCVYVPERYLWNCRFCVIFTASSWVCVQIFSFFLSFLYSTISFFHVRSARLNTAS